MTYNNNGDWNAEGRQIYNVNQTFNTEDLIPDIKYIKGKTIWSDSYGNFNARNKVIFNNRINGNNTDAVNVKWVNDRFVKLAGSTMSGNLDMNNNRIYNLPLPTGNNQPTTKVFTDLTYLSRDGTTSMSGNLNMNNAKIINLIPPISDTDSATKKYVDDRLNTKANAATLGNYLKKDGSVAMTGDLNLNNKKKLTYRLDMT